MGTVVTSRPALRTQAKAPGKLFLLGEYAVLYGAPAIVQAVDRYVVVEVEENPGDLDIVVMSPGTNISTLRGNWLSESSLSYEGSSKEHELVMTVLDALVEQGTLCGQLGPLKCTINSEDLFHNDNKLGLGSSAAVTHALVHAIAGFAQTHCEINNTACVACPELDFIFNVHRAFQHGRGSGADIGAGAMGHTFAFQRASEHVLPEMNLVTLPKELHYSTVWVKRSASTTRALNSLAIFQAEHPAQFSLALSPLLELAEEGVAALAAGDAKWFVRVCDDYGHNLSEFGRTVGVDIMSSEHRALRQLAQKCGVAFKPSGAGNGDFGIGFSLDIKALESFNQRATSAGFSPMQFGLGQPCHGI